MADDDSPSTLRRTLVSLQNRTNRLASHFGHKDFATLEKAVGLKVEIGADAVAEEAKSEKDDKTSTSSLTSAQLKENELTTVRKQLIRLQAQYDDLKKEKEELAEKYKADYRKWKEFKKWLLKRAEGVGEEKGKDAEEKENNVDGKGKGKEKAGTPKRKREEREEREDGEGTGGRDVPSTASGNPTREAGPEAADKRIMKQSKSSTSVAVGAGMTRSPLRPVAANGKVNEDRASDSAGLSKSVHPFHIAVTATTTASPDPALASAPGPSTIIVKLEPTSPTRSHLHDARPTTPKHVPGPSGSKCVTSPRKSPKKKRRRVDDGVSVGVVKGVNVKREEVVEVREDMVEGMASKIFSSCALTGSRHRNINQPFPAALRAAASSPSKGKGREIMPTVAPAKALEPPPLKQVKAVEGNAGGRDDGHKRHHELERDHDYAQYKGKGRYGDGSTSTRPFLLPDTEATSSRGVIGASPHAFAYEDVERSRGERKKMHAEDCWCCKDYYETINGVLPPRLQAPLWKSPTSSRTRVRGEAPVTEPQPRRHHKHKQNRKDMPKQPIFDASHDPDFDFPDTTATTTPRPNALAAQHHKQAISRHRHHFPTPATPPDYWEIGFPTTQDVERINERARAARE